MITTRRQAPVSYALALGASTSPTLVAACVVGRGVVSTVRVDGQVHRVVTGGEGGGNATVSFGGTFTVTREADDDVVIASSEEDWIESSGDFTFTDIGSGIIVEMLPNADDGDGTGFNARVTDPRNVGGETRVTTVSLVVERPLEVVG